MLCNLNYQHYYIFIYYTLKNARHSDSQQLDAKPTSLRFLSKSSQVKLNTETGVLVH